MTEMTPKEQWLAAVRPFVRGQLPAAPAQVLEIGCGPTGGFVPDLLATGYDAVGVDPVAPDGDPYRQETFEEYAQVAPAVDAVVACVSLHHVEVLDDVVDRIAATLAPGGVLVVVEWAHEKFDAATARWCFDRLGDAGEPGWLHAQHDHWREHGGAWEDFHSAWVRDEGLHSGEDIVRALRTRFSPRVQTTAGPYFFAELDGITEAAEQEAIDAGLLQGTCIRFTGAATSDVGSR